MRESFLATIVFAALALVMVFLANLVAFAFTGSGLHLTGVLLSIGATTASYAAEHDYTNAAQWLIHHLNAQQPGYAGPADPDAWVKYQHHERRGVFLQLLAILTAVIATGLFWLGV